MTISEEILSICKKAQLDDSSVVLATGVFDILHTEHISFLEKAKQAGDVLIVGLESDARVKELKGISRPVTTQSMRKKNLEKVAIADAVFVLPESFSSFDEHLTLLKILKPDYLAVSSHSLHLDKKRALMKKVDGELLVVHQHNPAISTTKLLAV